MVAADRELASEAGVRALLDQGRLEAAQQLGVRLTRRGVSARLAPMLLDLARAYQTAGQPSVAATWLAKLLVAAPNPQDLEAAEIAMTIGKPRLASELFDKADRYRHLSDGHRLQRAQATLAAAEQVRLPRGRHGAWVQHEELLADAKRQFESLTVSEVSDLRLLGQAWTGVARVLRLQKAQTSEIEHALVRAAWYVSQSSGLP